MFERTDEKLIQQAIKGKKSAWLALVRRYERNLYNYTVRMVDNPDDALDLMQDIFMAVFRNLASFRGDSPFKGWLFKIAHYRCIEFYRRRKPTQALDDVPEPVQSEADGPERRIYEDQQTQQLYQAMKQLSFNQRIVVEMKFFQQFTFDEIAHQLGVSANTIKTRLYSALDKLKIQLEVTDVK